jgi:hypothetical protein
MCLLSAANSMAVRTRLQNLRGPRFWTRCAALLRPCRWVVQAARITNVDPNCLRQGVPNTYPCNNGKTSTASWLGGGRMNSYSPAWAACCRLSCRKREERWEDACNTGLLACCSLGTSSLQRCPHRRHGQPWIKVDGSAWYHTRTAFAGSCEVTGC